MLTSIAPNESWPLFLGGAASPPLGPRNQATLKARHTLPTEVQLRRALRFYLAAETLLLEPIYDGYGASVYRARIVGDGDLIIKVGVFTDIDSPVWDAGFSLCIRNARVPVLTPRLRLVDLTGTIVVAPYIVMDALPGAPALTLWESDSGPSLVVVAEAMATSLSQIHQIPFESPAVQSVLTFFGLERRETQLADQLAEHARVVEQLTALQVLTKQQGECWIVLSESTTARAVDNPCLLHADPSPRNFLFDRECCVGVIDGSVRGGHCLEDVAKAISFLSLTALRFAPETVQSAIRAFIDTYTASRRAVGGLLEDLPAILIRYIARRLMTAHILGRLQEESGCLLSFAEHILAGHLPE